MEPNMETEVEKKKKKKKKKGHKHSHKSKYICEYHLGFFLITANTSFFTVWGWFERELLKGWSRCWLEY